MAALVRQGCGAIALMVLAALTYCYYVLIDSLFIFEIVLQADSLFPDVEDLKLQVDEFCAMKPDLSVTWEDEIKSDKSCEYHKFKKTMTDLTVSTSSSYSSFNSSISSKLSKTMHWRHTWKEFCDISQFIV